MTHNRSYKSLEEISNVGDAITARLEMFMRGDSETNDLMDVASAKHVTVIWDKPGFHKRKGNKTYYSSGKGNENKLLFEVSVHLDAEVTE